MLYTSRSLPILISWALQSQLSLQYYMEFENRRILYARAAYLHGPELGEFTPEDVESRS
jgi:hypothetical protein